MKQLELPLKFKPNTYESYTDIQKKEYWYANYCIQLQKIDTAVRMLKGLIDHIDQDQIDHGGYIKPSLFRYFNARIRKICNDLKDKK